MIKAMQKVLLLLNLTQLCWINTALRVSNGCMPGDSRPGRSSTAYSRGFAWGSMLLSEHTLMESSRKNESNANQYLIWNVYRIVSDNSRSEKSPDHEMFSKFSTWKLIFFNQSQLKLVCNNIQFQILEYMTISLIANSNMTCNNNNNNRNNHKTEKLYAILHCPTELAQLSLYNNLSF